MAKKLTVVDFFCGAGGFSEGFRQQGFKIIMGVDFWQPAVESHNLNHGLNDTPKNILCFWSSGHSNVEEIDKIPNSDVIVGSPSCVSFSMSNKSGKSDKSHGIKLIEAYLRVVAVKKHQKNSILRAWYMENVPQSRKHVKPFYTFKDLNLGSWALTINKQPNDIALKVGGGVYNAGDFGAPQERKRFLAGEWVKTGEFLELEITHKDHVKCSAIRKLMPKPNETKQGICIDPNYPSIKIPITEITSHFYDTGLYKIQWEQSQHYKIDHPFMGRMSFPENEARTSRTITATKSSQSRESIVYKSEYQRKGDGEFRLPTIREIACLMGYPYVYQFVGSEGVKWKQIGNSVCPHMSSALAKALRKKMGLKIINTEDIDFSEMKDNYKFVTDLNTFERKIFDSPSKRSHKARFRRHAIKMGNMTVDLMNYHPDRKDVVAKKWYLSTFFGTGNRHDVKVLRKNHLNYIENILLENCHHFSAFKNKIESDVLTSVKLQKIYEEDLHLVHKDNPLNILKRLSDIIKSFDSHKNSVSTNKLFPKENIPVAQLMAMYGLMKLINTAK